MPICTVTTSIKGNDIPANFNIDMNKFLAEVLDKPMSALVTILNSDACLNQGDSQDPCVYVSIEAIDRFDAERNPKYAIKIRDFLIEKLKLPDDRVVLLLKPLEKWHSGKRPQMQ